MRRYRRFFICFLVLALALSQALGCRAQQPRLQTPFRVNGKAFEQATGSGWQDVFVDGVNLGVGKPGCWPGEFGVTEEDYYRWFGQIAAMNVSFLRVYVLQMPAFYEAFYRYNSEADAAHKLYLFHGVYCDEDTIAAYYDAFCENGAFRDGFYSDIEAVSRVIHGDATVAQQPGCAYGTYARDISDYVAGYILGIEWSAPFVLGTNAANPEQTAFSGDYVYTRDASPFEVFLAGAAETAIRTDAEYGTQRPVALCNWITTDPLSHPAEPDPEMEDAVSVDVEHIRAKAAFSAGFFASYHVYPYYPDFLNYDAGLAEVGNGSTYLGYLKEINDYHSMPVLVAEYGVPISRGRTHESEINNMPQGDNNEADQAADIIEMNRMMHEAGMMGGLVFSWQDEWFKTAWNAMEIELTERRPYWYNVQSSEQAFGILAFDPGETPVCTVDGSAAEWIGDTPVLADEEYSVYTRADAAYLYLLVRYNPTRFSPERQALCLPLDVVAGQGNSGFEGAVFSEKADFLIRLTADAGSVTVDPYYDVFHFQYAYLLSMVAPVPHQTEPDSGTFVPIYQALSEPLTLPLTGEEIPFGMHDTGVLRAGTADPASADYNSLADFCWGDGAVEVRLPWMLLNVTDPSTRQILNDLYAQDTLASHTAADFHIGAYAGGETGPIDMRPFTWEGWETPAYRERLKASYPVLQAYFGAGRAADAAAAIAEPSRVTVNPLLTAIVDVLVVVMSGLLALFVLWLFLLHLITNIRSKRFAALKARLLALINENLKMRRFRSQLHSLVDPEGEVEQLREISGIRSKRGVRVIELLIPELDERRRRALREAVLDPWYMKYLRRKLACHDRDFVFLVMKLAGDLALDPFKETVLMQTYRYRTDSAAQQIGLTALCAFGDESGVLRFCADPAVRLQLSFRTVQEIFAAYAGDKLSLFPALLETAADDYVRRACIKRIGAEHLDTLAPRVEAYLAADSVNLRIDAIRTLGELGCPDAGDRIAAQSDDPRWEVRSTAITALAKIDAEKYLKQILTGLFDSEWWVRSHAAEALAKRADCRVILEKVEKRNDRYAYEMLRFHIRRRELLEGEIA